MATAVQQLSGEYTGVTGKLLYKGIGTVANCSPAQWARPYQRLSGWSHESVMNTLTITPIKEKAAARLVLASLCSSCQQCLQQRQLAVVLHTDCHPLTRRPTKQKVARHTTSGACTTSNKALPKPHRLHEEEGCCSYTSRLG